MQMAAKVVYYGPGLCGKTTNLHYIYQHTAGESRGEMVSLETETDRTLFFDLLPIDVGSIAGFNTRIQLYTVPGQVFYNTTRKLVLKGVDGVVFVADSQRAMLQANIDSFRNLEENLAEMGLAVDSLPLVLQFNKRDLPDICTLDELNAALNRNAWPHFEASAVTGEGVFETLKGISKHTLMSLKKRLGRSEGASAPAPPPRPPAAPPRPASTPPPVAAAPKPAPAPPPRAAAPPAAPAAPGPPAPAQAARLGSGGTGKMRSVDVLSELERLRQEATARPRPPAATTTPPRTAAAAPIAPAATPAAAPLPAAPRATPPNVNGNGELSRSIEMTLKRADFQRARRFSV